MPRSRHHLAAVRQEHALFAGVVLAFATVIALSTGPWEDRSERIRVSRPAETRDRGEAQGAAPRAVKADPGGFAALIHAGAFEAALEMARLAPGEFQTEWWPQLFGAWAEREPAFAPELAASCLAAGLEGRGFHAGMDRWAAAAPGSAAAFVLALPPGTARAEAFRLTLPAWVRQDPAAVAAVLPGLVDPEERDATAAALIACTDTANRSTASAIAWAEQIGNPARRVDALVRVVGEWLQHDPAAAVNYLAGPSRLTDAEREALRVALRPPRAGDPI